MFVIWRLLCVAGCMSSLCVVRRALFVVVFISLVFIVCVLVFVFVGCWSSLVLFCVRCLLHDV